MYNFGTLKVNNFNELCASFLNGQALCQMEIDKPDLLGFLTESKIASKKDERLKMLFYHLLYKYEEGNPSSLCLYYLLKEAVLGNDPEACHDLGNLYLRKGKKEPSDSFFSKAMRMGFLPSFRDHARGILQNQNLPKVKRLLSAEEDLAHCLSLKEEDIFVSIEYCQGILEGKRMWDKEFVKKMKLAAKKSDSFSMFLLASSSVCGFFLKEDYALARLFFKKAFKDEKLANEFFKDPKKIEKLSSFTYDLLSNGIEVPLPTLIAKINVVK